MSVISATFAEAFGEQVYDENLPTGDAIVAGHLLRSIDERVRAENEKTRAMIREVWGGIYNLNVLVHGPMRAINRRPFSMKALWWALASGVVKFLHMDKTDFEALRQDEVSYVMSARALLDSRNQPWPQTDVAVHIEELLKWSLRYLPEFDFLRPESSRAVPESELRALVDNLARTTGFVFMVFSPNDQKPLYFPKDDSPYQDGVVLSGFDVSSYFSGLGRLIPLLDAIPAMSKEEIDRRHFVAKQIIYHAGVVDAGMQDTLQSFNATSLMFNSLNTLLPARHLDKLLMLCSVRDNRRFKLRGEFPSLPSNTDIFTLLENVKWTDVFGEQKLSSQDYLKLSLDELNLDDDEKFFPSSTMIDRVKTLAKEKAKKDIEVSVKRTRVYGIVTKVASLVSFAEWRSRLSPQARRLAEAGVPNALRLAEAGVV